MKMGTMKEEGVALEDLMKMLKAFSERNAGELSRMTSSVTVNVQDMVHQFASQEGKDRWDGLLITAACYAIISIGIQAAYRHMIEFGEEEPPLEYKMYAVETIDRLFHEAMDLMAQSLKVTGEETPSQERTAKDRGKMN